MSYLRGANPINVISLSHYFTLFFYHDKVMNSFQHMTDQALVNSYLSGCNEAFDCLLYRYKDRLYHYILSAVHDRELADDIFQDTFTKAIVHLQQGRYADSGRFYAWLTRIAHNLIIDTFRQDSGAIAVSAEEHEFEVSQQEQCHYDFRENQLTNEQTLREVKWLMEALPQAQREVVFMRFYQELSFKEIAAQTGVSINTSLGRFRYALQNMRKMAKENRISLELL